MTTLLSNVTYPGWKADVTTREVFVLFLIGQLRIGNASGARLQRRFTKRRRLFSAVTDYIVNLKPSIYLDGEVLVDFNT